MTIGRLWMALFGFLWVAFPADALAQEEPQDFRDCVKFEREARIACFRQMFEAREVVSPQDLRDRTRTVPKQQGTPPRGLEIRAERLAANRFKRSSGRRKLPAHRVLNIREIGHKTRLPPSSTLRHPVHILLPTLRQPKPM